MAFKLYPAGATTSSNSGVTGNRRCTPSVHIIYSRLAPSLPLLAAQAMEYRSRIMQAVPDTLEFEPLMTLYLTDGTKPADVHAAKDKGIVAFKLYPAGATTNSDSGVTDINRCIPTLQAMSEVCRSQFCIASIYCFKSSHLS